MLKQRIITALILVPLVVAGVLWLPDNYFALFFGAFALVGSWEWTKFSCANQGTQATLLRLVYVALVAGSLFFSWHYVIVDEQLISVVLMVALVWWVLAIVQVITFPASAALHKNLIVNSAIGMLVITTTWIAIVSLRNNQLAGREMLLYLMILIAVADTGAYFGGRKWGKRKLAPKVSPGKSWEGVISGLLCVVAVALTYAILLRLPEQSWSAVALFIAISLVTAMFSIVGDLTESIFKREAGLKDSGNILPGHGGILDRIDSLTAAAPVFLACLTWFYI